MPPRTADSETVGPVPAARYFQFKVTLVGSKPPIWRRIQVPDRLSVHQFHLVIQAAMGWTNNHQYSFIMGAAEYQLPNAEEEEDFGDFENPKKKKLREIVASLKVPFKYIYDLDDEWEHEIILEKSVSGALPYPSCLEGERACPPEDSGGVSGYEAKLAILKNKSHPEYKETREWIGREFDPEIFDLEEKKESVRDYKVMEVSLDF